MPLGAEGQVNGAFFLFDGSGGIKLNSETQDALSRTN